MADAPRSRSRNGAPACSSKRRCIRSRPSRCLRALASRLLMRLPAAARASAAPSTRRAGPGAGARMRRATSGAPLAARAIGSYAKGCVAGATALPVDGETWQVMRLSRNRNWGHPRLIGFLERLSKRVPEINGWPGLLVGDLARPRVASDRPRRRYLADADAGPQAQPD